MIEVSAPGTSTRTRVESIDLLRGIVMVIMVLDHTRDFVHAGAFRFDPSDLTQTNAALFLTRWITHVCAPVFVFFAGTGSYLQRMRGATTGEVSRFLLTRGLWLIVLEFTVVRTGSWFSLDFGFLGMAQVIWVIGVSMVLLAALVHAPLGAIAVVGAATVVLHNLLDGIRVPGWEGPGSPVPDAAAKLWLLLHQGGTLMPVLGEGSPTVLVLYPLVPWVGVMAAGYAFGAVYELPAERRRRLLLTSGGVLTAAFVVLRATNLYGDPSPWTAQPSALFTVFSFVNATKYPPSLLFLLMTLGPSLLALAWFESARPRGFVAHALITFGRVPLFFYLLQWPLAHGAGVLLGVAAGKDVRHLFQGIPEVYINAPPDAGFPLWVVWVSWAAIVVVLFFLCRWYAEVKRRHPASLLRYL